MLHNKLYALRRWFKVYGAGNPAVNGYYAFDTLLQNQDNTCSWALVPTAEQQLDPAAYTAQQQQRVVLFRCSMKSKEKHWYLSIPNDPATPGSEKVKLHLLEHI
jgi:hypothetical protein